MNQPASDMHPGVATPEASVHSFDSSLREQALGHQFLSLLLVFMWRNGRRNIEVLKGEVDCGGYDLVLEANGVVRHVQLKSSFHGSKVREVDISTKLLRKPAVASCGLNSILKASPSSGSTGSAVQRGRRCLISARESPATPKATAKTKKTSAPSIGS